MDPGFFSGRSDPDPLFSKVGSASETGDNTLYRKKKVNGQLILFKQQLGRLRLFLYDHPDPIFLECRIRIGTRYVYEPADTDTVSLHVLYRDGGVLNVHVGTVHGDVAARSLAVHLNLQHHHVSINKG